MAIGTPSDLYAEVDAEIERLKGLSGRAVGREDDGAVVVQHPMAVQPSHQSRASPAPINPAQILDNIQRLSAALKASNERAVAADERARRAEARANEAEQWLRRLHQAVQDSMRAGRVS